MPFRSEVVTSRSKPMAAATVSPAKDTAHFFVPREHGATAMLLTPFLAAAILLREVNWPELVAFLAIACALAVKDPLVVVARQRWVWKQEHAETKPAIRSAALQSLLLAACGATLILVRGWHSFIWLFLGAGAFTILAVTVNVRNRQRSEWFQVASAVALTSTSLVACLAAKGAVPGWCWMLWLLCALQAAAGIFVVHSRLDARIAARKGHGPDSHNRRAAFACDLILFLAGVLFAFLARPWIAAALFLAAIGYFAELRRQRNPDSLTVSLKRIGLEALGFSTFYSWILLVGLWHG